MFAYNENNYEEKNYSVNFLDNNSLDDEFNMTKSIPYNGDEQQVDFEVVNPIMNPYSPEASLQEDEDDSKLNDERYFNNINMKKENNNSNIEEKPEPKKNEKIIKKSNQKETRETTDKVVVLSIKKKTKLFESKTKKCRNDYLIKKIKVNCFSKFATNKLKSLVKKCQFQGDLKSAKVYLPDNKAFTQDSNLKRNKVFLDKTLRFIYTLEDDDKLNKGRNAKLFAKIDGYTGEKNNEAYDALKKFLDQTVRDTIIEYYDSAEFEKFSGEEDITENDKAFFKEKGFHLLEKYGFLDLINNKY